MMELYYSVVKSPVGKLTLVASQTSLVAVLWPVEKPNRVKLPQLILDNKNKIIVSATIQLEEYFAGKRNHFDLPLDPIGTEFQKKVWNALRKIPFGATRSYGEIAKSIGKPTASRAVGAANGRNPISIIVPCHRVIGANGSLTGFAGGLEAKEILLICEGNSSLHISVT